MVSGCETYYRKRVKHRIDAHLRARYGVVKVRLRPLRRRLLVRTQHEKCDFESSRFPAFTRAEERADIAAARRSA